MDLNRRRQVKKDEDVLSRVPRSKEKFREEGEKGKGIKTNFDITYIKSITIDKRKKNPVV